MGLHCSPIAPCLELWRIEHNTPDVASLFPSRGGESPPLKLLVALFPMSVTPQACLCWTPLGFSLLNSQNYKGPTEWQRCLQVYQPLPLVLYHQQYFWGHIPSLRPGCWGESWIQPVLHPPLPIRVTHIFSFPELTCEDGMGGGVERRIPVPPFKACLTEVASLLAKILFPFFDGWISSHPKRLQSLKYDPLL